MPRIEIWLWARKGGKLYFISADNPKVRGFGDPHNNWFESMHWPTYGTEFDRILRGVIQSDFPSAGEIEFTAYKGSVGHIQDEFVPNNVIREFLSKHKKYKNYNIRSNPMKRNSFLDSIFGKRTYSAKTKEWTSSKHKKGVPGFERGKGSKRRLESSESDLQKLFDLRFENEKDLRKTVGRVTKRKKNGLFDSSAEDLAQGFHGRGPRAEYDIIEKEKYSKDQAVIGFLEELEILAEDLQSLTPISFPHEDHRSAFAKNGKKEDTVFVTFPNRNQLEFHGGNQELPIEDSKKLVTVGPVWGICYWTDKYHLSDGTGFSSYHHNFGEESAKGNNEKPSLALVERRLPFLPKLIYDCVNKKCLLVGGKYTVADEGITN